MPLLSFAVRPATQTTRINVYTGPYTVSWVAPIGDTTPQAFTLSDGGGGGTFSTGTTVNVLYGDGSFTFEYKNAIPGTYTLTVHAGAGPLSGASDQTVIAIVTAGGGSSQVISF